MPYFFVLLCILCIFVVVTDRQYSKGNVLNLPKSESFDNKSKRTSSSVQSKYEEEAKKKLKKRPELIKNPPKPPSTSRQNPTASSSTRKSHDIKGWMASAKRPRLSDSNSDEENIAPHPVSSPEVTTPTGNSRSSNTGITRIDFC